VDILKLLLKHTSVDRVNKAIISTHHYTLLIWAVIAMKPRTTEVIKLLLDAGADVDIKPGREGTVVHAAVAYGSPEILRILLEANADVNSRDGWWRSPFWLSFSRKKIEHMKLLLQYGADSTLGASLYSAFFVGMTKESKEFNSVFHIEAIKMLYAVWSCTDLYSLEEWLIFNCDKPEVLTLIHEVGFAPRSLMSMCRLVVRDAMMVRGPNGVNRLPLPKLLKNYLLFSDLQ